MEPMNQENQMPEYVPPPELPIIKKIITPKFVAFGIGIIVIAGLAYGGIWYWGNQQVAKEVVPTVTPRADATAGWKTYTNTQYGFNFKYPSDWSEPQQYEGMGSIEILNLGCPTIKMGGSASCPLFVYINKANSDVSSVEKYLLPDPNTKAGSIENSTINGFKTASFTIPDNPGDIKYTVFFGNYNIIFEDYALTYEQNGIIGQILSTFKFTNFINTSTWKTYANTQYGFEFKYPQNWVATEKNGELCFGESGKQYMLNAGIVCGVSIRVYIPGSCDTNCSSAASLIKMRNDPNEITTVGGEKAITQAEDSSQTFPSIITLVDHTNKTYEIQTPVPAEVRDVYSGILSTFKFTK